MKDQERLGARTALQAWQDHRTTTPVCLPIKISLLLGEWLHNVQYLVVIKLHAVQVARGSELDLADEILCFADCVQTLRLLQLHTRFPFLPIFHELPFISSVSSSLRKSLISSSLLVQGFPTGLYVLCLTLRPRFHSATLFAHRSSRQLLHRYHS